MVQAPTRIQQPGVEHSPERETGVFSKGRTEWSTWPHYEAAVLGFRNYWYPVLWSRDVGRKPISIKVAGEKIMLVREEGTVRALHDRCPHRGVPLSQGSREFPGTLSCVYHGWTFNLESGDLVAAITDGPDSPICGRVRVKTYPVEERVGLIWVFIGDIDPPPVEADIPQEMLREPKALCGRISIRPGNWRFAAENGFDEGHAKWLHRTTPYVFFRQMPVWSRTRVVPIEDNWITRVHDEVHFQTDFPGLGKWPRKLKWWKSTKGGAKTSIRLPSMLRVQYKEWTHFEFYVPVDADSHRYIQLAMKETTGLDAAIFKLRYWTYIRWLFHGLFNDQDAEVVDVMDAPPERLYRPDVSILGWRKLCESPRGTVGSVTEVREYEVEELEEAQQRESVRA